MLPAPGAVPRAVPYRRRHSKRAINRPPRCLWCATAVAHRRRSARFHPAAPCFAQTLRQGFGSGSETAGSGGCWELFPPQHPPVGHGRASWVLRTCSTFDVLPNAVATAARPHHQLTQVRPHRRFQHGLCRALGSRGKEGSALAVGAFHTDGDHPPVPAPPRQAQGQVHHPWPLQELQQSPAPHHLAPDGCWALLPPPRATRCPRSQGTRVPGQLSPPRASSDPKNIKPKKIEQLRTNQAKKKRGGNQNLLS